jgi:hypothetical protein
MPENSGKKPVYSPPRVLLVGGLGAAGLASSGLFTGRESPDYSGLDNIAQSSEDSRLRCIPGFGASGCGPGTGVTSISL